MGLFFTILVFVVVAVPAIAGGVALFEISPFGRHRDRYRDRLGRPVGRPPNLEDGHY